MSGEAVTEARLDPSCCHGDCSQLPSSELGILEISYSAAMGIKATKKKRRGGGGRTKENHTTTQGIKN